MDFEIYDRVIICNTGENSDNWILENAAGQIIGFYTDEYYIVQLDTPIRGGQTGVVISKHCLISELLVTKEL